MLQLLRLEHVDDREEQRGRTSKSGGVWRPEILYVGPLFKEVVTDMTGTDETSRPPK